MKKSFLIAMASFLSIGAYAQTQHGSALELKCTEEAVTFSANIQSGLHLYSPHIGYADMLKVTPNFSSSNLYTGKNNIPEVPLPANFEKAFTPGASSPQKNNLLLQKTIHNLFQIDETAINRAYTIYDYSKILPQASAGIITLN